MPNLCFPQLGGPIWSAPMHDAEFVQGLLDEVQARHQDYNTAARIKGLLTVISEVNFSHLIRASPSNQDT